MNYRIFDNKEAYENIYALIRRKEYQSALSIMLNMDLFELNSSFLYDKNHAWYVIGDIFYQNEELNNAIRSFKKSIYYCKEDWSAYFALGNCYSELSEPELALSFYKKALQLDKSNTCIVYNIGNAYFDIGDYKQAKEHYSLITKENSDKNIFRMAKNNLRAIKIKKG